MLVFRNYLKSTGLYQQRLSGTVRSIKKTFQCLCTGVLLCEFEARMRDRWANELMRARCSILSSVENWQGACRLREFSIGRRTDQKRKFKYFRPKPAGQLSQNLQHAAKKHNISFHLQGSLLQTRQLIAWDLPLTTGPAIRMYQPWRRLFSSVAPQLPTSTSHVFLHISAETAADMHVYQQVIQSNNQDCRETAEICMPHE